MKRSAGGTLLIVHTVLTLTLQLAARANPDLAGWLSSQTLLGAVSRAVLMQGGLILLPSLLVLIINRLPADSVWGGKSKPGSLILATVIGVPAAVVFHGLNNLTLYFMLRLGWKLPELDSQAAFTSQIWQQPLVVICILVLIQVLTPAVIEELMFRGILLPCLTVQATHGLAIFWQAVAFALFHNNPQFIVSPLLAGLLLGYLRIHGGSLLPSMLTHASLNLTLLVLTPLLPQLTAQYLNLPQRTTLSIFYASLIATFVAAVALVPLLALVDRLQVPGESEEQEIQANRAYFPGGWRFALALLLLLVTIGVTYYQSI